MSIKPIGNVADPQNLAQRHQDGLDHSGFENQHISNNTGQSENQDLVHQNPELY